MTSVPECRQAVDDHRERGRHRPVRRGHEKALAIGGHVVERVEEHQRQRRLLGRRRVPLPRSAGQPQRAPLHTCVHQVRGATFLASSNSSRTRAAAARGYRVLALKSDLLTHRAASHDKNIFNIFNLHKKTFHSFLFYLDF